MTEGASDTEVLADLDWQCRCQRCDSPAVNEVHTHLMDMCTNVAYADQWGNSITFLCAEHTRAAKRAAKSLVARLNKKPIDAPARCGSCGAPLVQMSDILRSIGAMTRRGEEARNE